MGLFRKKTDKTETTDTPPVAVSETPDTANAGIDELRAELEMLRSKLDTAEAARQDLEERLGTLDELVTSNANQHPLAATPTPPPPPTTEPEDTARLDVIESRLTAIDRIHERLNSLSASVAHQELVITARTDSEVNDGAVLGDISNRLEDLSAAVASHYTQLAATRDRLSGVDALEVRVTELDALLASQASGAGDREPGIDAAEAEALRSQLSQMAEKLASLDHRVTNVSVELANQLTELSSDLERLGTSASGSGDIDAAELDQRIELSLTAIKTGQERLAAEQARYEIQFRADLAELAERLRRPGS